MFKKLKAKLLAGLTAVACTAAAFGVWAQASYAQPTEANAEESATPITLTIESNNVSYSENVYVMYAVSTEGIEVETANVKMKFWKESQDYTNPNAAEVTRETRQKTDVVNGKECAIFYSYGLAAKEMVDDIYAQAYVEVDGETYYSEVEKYSVLQYVYERRVMIAQINVEELDEKDAEKLEVQKAMYTAMLNYGAAAQNLLNYNTENLANEEYTYVEIANATFADGFGYGMYKAGTALTVTPAIGYEFTGEGSEYAVDEETGAITFTVPEAEAFIDEESFTEGTEEPDVPVEPEEPEVPEGPSVYSKTYTFADYTAGTQYAENEVHVLDEFVTVTTTQCHFAVDGDLRIYSSDSHNGYAIISAKSAIDVLSFNAGNKADTLNVYGWNGNDWILIEGVEVASTYKDYTVVIGGEYKQIKLDVEGANQVRLKSFTLQDGLSYTAEVNEVVDFEIDGGATKDLSIANLYDGVTVAWTEDSEFAQISGATLTVANVQANFTLTAMFKRGENTITKTCTVTVNYVMSDSEKAQAAAEEFVFTVETVDGGSELTLPTETNEGVTVTWSIEDEKNATIENNVITFANPMGGATVVLTATFTCGEATVTNDYEISISYVADEQKVQNAVEAFTFDITKLYVGDVKEFATVAPSDDEISIEWTLEATDSATLEGNVLTATDVGDITLTATFSYNGEFAITKEYPIEVSEIATLTIPEALALGAEQEANAYTEEKYYVSGLIVEVTNTQYGNMYIEDEEGNKILVYGLYTENNVGYDAMETKPAVGYTIKVLSIVGNYNNTPQLKNATLVEMAEPTDAYKANYEANALTMVENVTGDKEIELTVAGKEYAVTVEWSVKTGAEIATVENGKLIITNPAEDTTVTVVAAVTSGEETVTKEFTVAVAHKGEGTVEPTTLAVFEFGANGSASHNDGSSATTYTETVNGYTLNITGGTKMYSGARDLLGNSCLKFGTSSVIGSMTFTVPENVTSVIIRVAKYKAKTSKIAVNGTSYTLTNSSDDGAYDEITVNTTSTKTVEFTTVSGGVRCMMNSIEFIGIA